MSDVLVAQTSGVDLRAPYMLAYFGQELDIADPYWYVSEVEDGPGPPGRATVHIQVSQGVVDEVAGSVALNPDGPSGLIKQGMMCGVFRRRFNADGTYDDALTMCGVVTSIEHDVDHDALIVTVEDGRALMRDVRIIGRWVYNNEYTAWNYQEGWPSHMNPGGRPNCVFDPAGHPGFAPYPDYGLADNQQVPDASCRYSGIACYWTLANALEHYRIWYGPVCPDDLLGVWTAAMMQWEHVKRVPAWISWPVGFGSEVDATTEINWNAGTGQNNSSGTGGARKGRDLNLNGLPLVPTPGDSRPGALDMILDAAGGWTWHMEYDDPAESCPNTMVAIPARYLGPTIGLDIPISANAPAATVFGRNVITGGRYVEDSSNTYTRFTAAGALAKIETRLSTLTSAGLKPAWSAADLASFLQDAVSLGFQQDGFQKASAKWWRVFTTWYLDPAYEFQAGTGYAGYPRAKVRRPVWPTLLSFRGNLSDASDIQPYPIRAEVSKDGGATWQPGVEADGIEVWDNGVIYMPGLRDSMLGGTPGSWYWTAGDWAQTAGALLAIATADVRLTLAIPCDHRLVYDLKPAASTTGNGNASPDVDKLDSTFDRGFYVDVRQLYEAWLRIAAYPIPESVGGSIPAADKTDPFSKANSIRSDYDLLQGHVTRIALDRGRLARGGPLVLDGVLANVYHPGTQINNFVPLGDATRQPFQARCVIGRRRLSCEKISGRVPSFHTKTELLELL